jgi:hypothetical protein
MLPLAMKFTAQKSPGWADSDAERPADFNIERGHRRPRWAANSVLKSSSKEHG